VLLLRQFSHAFTVRARLRDYIGVVLGAYPYQMVLSFAAAWAIVRYALGRDNWVKTRHHGTHLQGHAADRRDPMLSPAPPDRTDRSGAKSKVGGVVR
jgi:hypothetical protein